MTTHLESQSGETQSGGGMVDAPKGRYGMEPD